MLCIPSSFLPLSCHVPLFHFPACHSGRVGSQPTIFFAQAGIQVSLLPIQAPHVSKGVEYPLPPLESIFFSFTLISRLHIPTYRPLVILSEAQRSRKIYLNPHRRRRSLCYSHEGGNPSSFPSLSYLVPIFHSRAQFLSSYCLPQRPTEASYSICARGGLPCGSTVC